MYFFFRLQKKLCILVSLKNIKPNRMIQNRLCYHVLFMCQCYISYYFFEGKNYISYYLILLKITS